MREDEICCDSRLWPASRVMQAIRRTEWFTSRVNPLVNVTIRWGSYRFSEESETQKRFNIAPRVEKVGPGHVLACRQGCWPAFSSIFR